VPKHVGLHEKFRSNQAKTRRLRQPRVDSDERVIVEVLCIRCGRDLRGQKIGQRCPQCDHPVSDSVYGDFLIHADRATVLKLADAARTVKAGAGLLGLLVLALVLLALGTASNFAQGVSRVFDVMLFGALMVPIPATVGLVTLTQRYSWAYYRARYGRPAFLKRAALVMLLLLTLLIVLSLRYPVVVLNAALTLLAVAPTAMFLHGLRRLMQRVPNAELAGFARVAFVGVLVCGVALFVVLMLRSVGANNPDKQDLFLGSTVVCVVGGVMLGVGGYRLLVRVEQVLLRAAR